MDIYNNKKRKIKCIDVSENNWGNCDSLRKNRLTEGQIYTLIGIEIHSWHTKITLEEYPDKRFNSVHFKELSEV